MNIVHIIVHINQIGLIICGSVRVKRQYPLRTSQRGTGCQRKGIEMPIINTDRFLKHLQNCRECKRKDRISVKYMKEVIECYMATEELEQLPNKEKDD
jgi:hypothetical protein